MKLKSIWSLLILVLIILIVFNVLLVRQNYIQRTKMGKLAENEPFKFSPLSLAGTKPLCLKFLNPKTGKMYSPSLLLLVFFSPNDCTTCLQEMSIWNELHNKFSSRGLIVMGLSFLEDSIEVTKLAESEKVSFPIRFVDSSYVKQGIGLQITPFKVLLDSTLTVLYLNGPNTDIEDRQRFEQVIEKWARVYLPK